MIPLRNNFVNRFLPSVNTRPGGMNGINFGVDMQIPGVPVAPPTIAPQNRFNMNPPQDPTTINPSVDFAGEYAKLNQNRPNRLAYEQSINEGEPLINRGKWAKLGALLAAAGASVKGGAQAGANLGLSSYYEPQRQASERWDTKNQGLSKLAALEDNDIANQIKALEAKQQDYYRSEENKRQNIELGRQGKESEARLANIKDEMDRRDMTVYTDPNTGMTYRKNLKDNTVTEIAKTALTPAEKVTLARQEEEAKEAARLPGERARFASAEKVANINATSREAVANTNAARAREIAANRLKAAASKYTPMRPGDVYGNVLLDIASEVGKEDSGLTPDMVDWIKPNEAGIPTVDGGWRATAEQEEKLRRFITESIAKHRTAPAPPNVAAPLVGSKLPPGWVR